MNKEEFFLLVNALETWLRVKDGSPSIIVVICSAKDCPDDTKNFCVITPRSPKAMEKLVNNAKDAGWDPTAPSQRSAQDLVCLLKALRGSKTSFNVWLQTMTNFDRENPIAKEVEEQMDTLKALNAEREKEDEDLSNIQQHKEFKETLEEWGEKGNTFCDRITQIKSEIEACSPTDATRLACLKRTLTEAIDNFCRSNNRGD